MRHIAGNDRVFMGDNITESLINSRCNISHGVQLYTMLTMTWALNFVCISVHFVKTYFL